MSLANAAEVINPFLLVEQIEQPALRLIALDGVLLESKPAPEDELARRRAAKVGHVAVESVHAHFDAITQFAELVDGSMRTEFELTSDGQDVYGPDGRSLIQTGHASLEQAEAEAKKRPELAFEVDRRRVELDEIYAIVDMVNGEDANTMFLTSDFPEALLGTEQDIGGYNVTRKQTMARAVMIDKDKKIKLISQTLDGSNRQALDAVHADFGFQTAPGELLGQRRLMKLSSDEQAGIMDRTVQTYDRSMAEQQGGEWYAGRRPADYRNTYDFVCAQTDLIQECVQLRVKGELTDSKMYNLAAAMQKRFSLNKQHNIEFLPQTVAVNPAMLQQEIMMAGTEARQRGQSFSACGGTLRAEGLDLSTESLMKEAGYGNSDENADEDKYGSLTFKCPKGHKNTRPRGKLIDNCTTCKISVKC